MSTVALAATCSAPAWVVNAMVRKGLLPRGQSPIITHRRERATPRWCRCGEPVWTGLAEREDVVLDPTPTTTEGELFALLDGRRTYQTTRHDEIWRRRIAHIEVDTANKVAVYIAHKCGGPHAIPNPIWQPPVKPDFDNPPY